MLKYDRSRSFRFFVATMFVWLWLSAACYGQSNAKRYRFEAEAGGGWAGFADEGWIHHGIVGGSFRTFITGGMSVAPEVFYMIGPVGDSDVSVVPVIGYQFKRSARIQPYVNGGVGWLIHRQAFVSRSDWSTGPTFGVGGGFKIRISDRLYVAPEARLGWEPFLRTTVSLGYRF
jgi:hypothetical protein